MRAESDRAAWEASNQCQKADRLRELQADPLGFTLPAGKAGDKAEAKAPTIGEVIARS